MPLFGYRIVVVTPAGRRRYLELLVPQVMRYMDAGLVDEYQLWVNTLDYEDIMYMHELEKQHKGRIVLRYLPEGSQFRGNLSIHHFFQKCDEPNHVYVRFDDDIVFLDSKDAFRDFVLFRLLNPKFFLVYGTILNNAVLSHILQRHGSLDMKQGISAYECMDETGWQDGTFACNVHDQVLKYLENQTTAKEKVLDKFRMSNWILYYYERVSINCISWIGGALEKWADNGYAIADDEEYNLACKIPREKRAMNIIYGGFVCVHFAFYPQRDTVDQSPNKYLQRYKKLVGV